MPIEALPSAPARFRCTSATTGRERASVRATGELDVASAPELERVLDEAQTRARLVVLDLRDLAFIDTSGVHVIVDASRFARLAGRRLVVLCGAQTRDVLHLTRTIDEVDVRPAAASAASP